MSWVSPGVAGRSSFEGDPSQVGLEYLWGVLDLAECYTPTWAHSSADERAAFVEFMDLVASRRATHPDMHIYHYAPYETTALKRLAMRYQTKENELDDLLRAEVFVDLYAIVRSSVRVPQPPTALRHLRRPENVFGSASLSRVRSMALAD